MSAVAERRSTSRSGSQNSSCSLAYAPACTLPVGDRDQHVTQQADVTQRAREAASPGRVARAGRITDEYDTVTVRRSTHRWVPSNVASGPSGACVGQPALRHARVAQVANAASTSRSPESRCGIASM